jgi:hypothetical protein
MYQVFILFRDWQGNVSLEVAAWQL